MQRHDAHLRFSRAARRRHQIFERRAERIVIADVARAFVHAQQREEALGCIEIERFCNARRAAKREPRGAHPRHQRCTSPRRERRTHHVGKPPHSRGAFGRQLGADGLCGHRCTPIARIGRLRQRIQVGKRDAAPRRPENGEPREPIGRLHECVGQRQQIENRLTLRQRFEIDRRKRDARPMQCRKNAVEMGSRAHQNRDVLASRGLRCFHERDDAIRLDSRVRVDGECWRVCDGRTCSDARCIRNGTAPKIVACGENLRKNVVQPLDDPRLRTEIARQIDECHGHVADSQRPLRLEKQPHFGLAKAIDRLHRVADREHGSAVSHHPPCRQAFEQRELRVGRILKFVDQQMCNGKIEPQQNVARRIGLAERVDRRQHRLRRVDYARVRERQLQLGRETRQKLE